MPMIVRNSSIRWYILLVWTLTLLIGNVENVEAAPIICDFSGIVDDFYDPSGILDGSININSILNGHFTYDSMLPDLDPSSLFGLYIPLGDFFIATLGNYTFTSPYKIEIWNHTTQGDRYSPCGGVGSPVFTNGFDTFTDIGWSLILADNEGTVFQSDALPSTIPDLNEFEGKRFHILLFEGSNRVEISASISSLTLAPGDSDISVTPTAYDFGSVNVGSSSAPQTFTISNSGTADLVISDIALSYSTNYSLNVNGGSSPCGSTTPTIIPNNSCTVTVTFNPSSTGTKNANLTINSDGPYTPTLDVPLNGTGVIPSLIIDIKANGSDGPITITTTDVLTVTVSLSPASHTGEIANWYVVAYTPLSAGWYHYEHASLSWKPGFALSHRGELINLSPHTVLQRSGLPVGEYTFFFHIGMSGGKLYSDSVKVNIQ
jgi:hypothetical protein